MVSIKHVVRCHRFFTVLLTPRRLILIVCLSLVFMEGHGWLIWCMLLDHNWRRLLDLVDVSSAQRRLRCPYLLLNEAAASLEDGTQVVAALLLNHDMHFELIRV